MAQLKSPTLTLIHGAKHKHVTSKYTPCTYTLKKEISATEVRRGKLVQDPSLCTYLQYFHSQHIEGYSATVSVHVY